MARKTRPRDGRPVIRTPGEPSRLVDIQEPIPEGGLRPPKKQADPLDEEVYQSKLEGCRRAFQEGNLGALLEALALCRERDHEQFEFPAIGALGRGRIIHIASEDHWLEIPLWVHRGAAHLVSEYLATARIVRTGHRARWRTQYLEDMAHYSRWDAVEDARESGFPSASSREATPTMFEEAAKILAKRGEHFSPHTIRRSWLLVRKAMDKEPGRFLSFKFVGVRK